MKERIELPYRACSLTLFPLCLAACAAPASPVDTSRADASTQPASIAATQGSSLASAPPASSSPPPPDAGAPPAGPAQPVISAEEAERILFPQASAGWTSGDCPRTAADPERIRCMIGLRYKGDGEAARIAVGFYDASGGVAGVEREHVMEGGFRGKIRLVPEPPVGKYRKHLAWVSAASGDFDEFFKGLSARATAPITYRHRTIAWKFLRSVGRTTPSAYANDWTIGYNVSGSLHGSADAVRETLFHEIFHLNDSANRNWSRRVLGTLYDGIVARCGTKTPCLTPYAPNKTMVRGGTYYAFQPDNGDGVHEYAAELALRYYREHRAMLRGEAPARPFFKCGPEENARSWSLLIGEFFGGVDLLPACEP